jgi:hypothetical protein
MTFILYAIRDGETFSLQIKDNTIQHILNYTRAKSINNAFLQIKMWNFDV